MMHRSILCLDIGSGTQDALLHLPGQEPENCPKFVLPSPARAVGERIKSMTGAGRPVFLHGDTMGGGFHFMLKPHLEAGLGAAATEAAALSLFDDLERVRAMGIAVTEERPQGYASVPLADFDPGWWRAFLGAAGLDYPDLVLAAAQDHGFHPGKSNRVERFRLWERFLAESGGRPEALVFERVPAELTRLAALQRATGGGLVADTGAAAVLGALSDPEVEAESMERGVTVLNLGNSHTVAFLVFRGRVLGVYEHHTGVLDRGKLLADLAAFRAGCLPGQAVLDAWGHGCLCLDLHAQARGFEPLYILGPRRRMLEHDGVHLAPGGDMMLAGCFGLLKGWRLLAGRSKNAGARRE
jgi:uncharacterized protein (DUF1786 family)